MTPRQIHIKDGKKEYFIAIEDILFVKADGNYSTIYLTQHTKYPTIRIQIGQLWKLIEETVPSEKHTLARIGRSYVIAMKYLQYADPKKKTITLHTDKDVVLDNVPSEAVKAMLKLLSKEQRKEVLMAYSERMRLTLSLDDLNDEHFMENGHEYVDLGLKSGTLWATRNVNDNGKCSDFFAWGERYENDVFDEEEYIHSQENIELQSEYDTANWWWGSGWRIPTEEEWKELADQCLMNWCKTKEDIWGCLFTGPNGNHIFLPAYGFLEGHEHRDSDKGFYWTASHGSGHNPSAMKLMEYEDDEGRVMADATMFWKEPYLGMSIRPVIHKDSLTTEVDRTKKILFVEPTNFSEEDILMYGIPSVMDGWMMKSISLQSDISAAEEILFKTVKEFCPDVIIGYKSACRCVQQLNEYKRFLVEPDFNPSEVLVTGDCWILSEDLDDAEQYANCHMVELTPPYDISRWKTTRLIPIIIEVLNGTYKDANDKSTLYGKKLLIK